MNPSLLLITSSYPVGRHIAGVHIPQLIDELGRLGWDVQVVTQNCRANRYERESLPGGAQIHFFPWRGGFRAMVDALREGPAGLLRAGLYILNGVRTGRQAIRERRPEFIHAEWVIPGGLIALILSLLTGIPYSTRALGSDVMIARRKWYLRLVLRLILGRAAARFADGFDLARETERLAGGRPCHFAATSRQLGGERNGFQFEPDAAALNTLTVGRLHPTKGQDVLIEAVGLLKRRGVGVRSLLVGAGEERENLERRVRELGLEREITLAGRLEDGDIADLLARVDCVVIPSRSESIPLVLGEAVAAGRPVVASEVGDLGMLVRDYGLGRAVPAGDPAALAEALEETAKAPRATDPEQRSRLLDLLSSAAAARIMTGRMTEYLAGKKA